MNPPVVFNQYQLQLYQQQQQQQQQKLQWQIQQQQEQEQRLQQQQLLFQPQYINPQYIDGGSPTTVSRFSSSGTIQNNCYVSSIHNGLMLNTEVNDITHTPTYQTQGPTDPQFPFTDSPIDINPPDHNIFGLSPGYGATTQTMQDNNNYNASNVPRYLPQGNQFQPPMPQSQSPMPQSHSKTLIQTPQPPIGLQLWQAQPFQGGYPFKTVEDLRYLLLDEPMPTTTRSLSTGSIPNPHPPQVNNGLKRPRSTNDSIGYIAPPPQTETEAEAEAEAEPQHQFKRRAVSILVKAEVIRFIDAHPDMPMIEVHRHFEGLYGMKRPTMYGYLKKRDEILRAAAALENSLVHNPARVMKVKQEFLKFVLEKWDKWARENNIPFIRAMIRAQASEIQRMLYSSEDSTSLFSESWLNGFKGRPKSYTSEDSINVEQQGSQEDSGKTMVRIETHIAHIETHINKHKEDVYVCGMTYLSLGLPRNILGIEKGAVSNADIEGSSVAMLYCYRLFEGDVSEPPLGGSNRWLPRPLIHVRLGPVQELCINPDNYPGAEIVMEDSDITRPRFQQWLNEFDSTRDKKTTLLMDEDLWELYNSAEKPVLLNTRNIFKLPRQLKDIAARNSSMISEFKLKFLGLQLYMWQRRLLSDNLTRGDHVTRGDHLAYNLSLVLIAWDSTTNCARAYCQKLLKSSRRESLSREQLKVIELLGSSKIETQNILNEEIITKKSPVSSPVQALIWKPSIPQCQRENLLKQNDITGPTKTMRDIVRQSQLKSNSQELVDSTHNTVKQGNWCEVKSQPWFYKGKSNTVHTIGMVYTSIARWKDYRASKSDDPESANSMDVDSNQSTSTPVKTSPLVYWNFVRSISPFLYKLTKSKKLSCAELRRMKKMKQEPRVSQPVKCETSPLPPIQPMDGGCFIWSMSKETSMPPQHTSDRNHSFDIHRTSRREKLRRSAKKRIMDIRTSVFSGRCYKDLPVDTVVTVQFVIKLHEIVLHPFGILNPTEQNVE
ncbi:hypothetical protein BGZ76_010955 [Entomortierella beljakovae]|nr:hypothetical protein BGZ76_010955 [Entomortierella beljakovae]